MNISDFRAIVDSVVREDNQLERFEDYKSVYNFVASVCGKYTADVHGTLIGLIKRIAFDYFINGAETDPYLNILESLVDAMRGTQASPVRDYDEGQVVWVEIVRAVYSGRNHLHIFNRGGSDSFDSQLSDLAVAAKRLSDSGVAFNFINNEVYISVESHALINEKISRLSKCVGGRKLLDDLFQMLVPVYDSGLGRYLIYRSVTMGLHVVDPAYPWGYYMALGIQNIDSPGGADAESALSELVSFVRDLITVFEIQPYSVWEGVFVDESKYLQFLGRGVSYDGLVSFPQISGRHARSVIKALTLPFSLEGHESNGVKLSVARQVALALIDLSKQKSPSVVSVKSIVRKSGVRDDLVRLAMQVLTHPRGSANRELSFPPLNEKLDSNFKPAFKVEGGYYLLPRSLTALGAVNSLLNMISRPDGVFNNDLDNKLGQVLEAYIHECFRDKGVASVAGEFEATEGGDSGECDIVVEGENKIFLLEVKKKALTRRALSGVDYELLKDLSESLLKSHSQAMKAECQLKRKAGLKLKASNGDITEIELAGREVERISVSLHDFGSLQDRVTLQTILRVAMNVRFVANFPAAVSAVEKWRECVEDIIRYGRELGEFGTEHAVPFYNSSFMSVPQLLTLLEDCTSSSCFEHQVGLGRSITRGTRDFYKEYAANKAMHARR